MVRIVGVYSQLDVVDVMYVLAVLSSVDCEVERLVEA
jgi:hypothetical protein